MTSGRRSRISPSSSAWRRAAPSGVSAPRSSGGPGWDAAPRRHHRGGRSLPRGSRWSTFGLGRSPVGSLGVPVGQLDDPRRRRRYHDRFRQQRAGQASSFALTRRAAEVREREDGVRVVKRRPRGVADPGRERGEQRVLVFLDRGRRAPPDPGTGRHPERMKPVPAGVRPSVAERGREERRHAAADRVLGRAHVEDRFRGQPERGQARGEGLGRRSPPVEAEVVEAFEPLADTRQLEWRGRQRRRDLDHEHARSGRREGSAPDGRTVGQQAHGAQEGGGASIGAHRSDGTRESPGVSCAGRGDRSFRLGRMSQRTPTQPFPRSHVASVRRATIVGAALAVLVTAFGPASGASAVDPDPGLRSVRRRGRHPAVRGDPARDAPAPTRPPACPGGHPGCLGRDPLSGWHHVARDQRPRERHGPASR